MLYFQEKGKLILSVDQSFMHSMFRDSLLEELKATKEVLITSLKTIDKLEIEAGKVPLLEAKIADLEKR